MASCAGVKYTLKYIFIRYWVTTGNKAHFWTSKSYASPADSPSFGRLDYAATLLSFWRKAQDTENRRGHTERQHGVRKAHKTVKTGGKNIQTFVMT